MAKNFSEWLEYRDGALFWKKKPSQAVSIGDAAGSLNGGGYLQLNLFGRSFQNHRIVYAMHHGVAPEFVDHINGDKTDNRIENLRPATKMENRQNSKKPITNTSGHKNVQWVGSRNRWRVSLTVKGRTKYFGHFVDYEKAVEAACLARENNFGRFANHG